MPLTIIVNPVMSKKIMFILFLKRVLSSSIDEKVCSVVAADTERFMTNRSNLSTIEYVVALPIFNNQAVK